LSVELLEAWHVNITNVCFRTVMFCQNVVVLCLRYVSVTLRWSWWMSSRRSRDCSVVMRRRCWVSLCTQTNNSLSVC